MSHDDHAWPYQKVYAAALASIEADARRMVQHGNLAMITPERLAEMEQTNAAMRQILIALRIQLKADRRQKWKHAIARIEELLASREGGQTE